MGLSRAIHADTLAALSGYFHPVVAVFVDWPGQAVRVHSGGGTLTWGGHSWTGVGALESSLALPAETGGLAMLPGAITVRGDDTQVDSVHTDAADAYGATVQVWFGAVTERAGTTIIGDLFQAFAGTIGEITDAETWTSGQPARPMTFALLAGPSQRSRGAARHSYEDQPRHDATDTAGRWLRSALSNAIQTAQNR